jgi:hypothetical protein
VLRLRVEGRREGPRGGKWHMNEVGEKGCGGADGEGLEGVRIAPAVRM